MSRRPRAYHDGPLVAGETISLDPEEAKHVRRVLRLRPGDALETFDGRGLVAFGRVVDLDGATGIRLDSCRRDDGAPAFELTLALAGLRAERFEWAVQKGTELGVAAFRTLSTARTERPGGRPDRLRRIAIEACKQCGRNRVPELRGPASLPWSAPETGEGWLLDGSATETLVSRLDRETPGSLRLAVGPEGGFTPEERARFVLDGWRAVRLGPRILRAETAAIAAATLVLARWGDLGDGGSARNPGISAPGAAS